MKKSKDFSVVTESPDTKVPIEQLQRYFQRYKFAQQFVHNKKVLEIGCGGGQGLFLLSEKALFVKGIDIEKKNIEQAKNVYKYCEKINIEYHDANKLNFPNQSFDTILLFETIYYLENAKKVIGKCRDLLTKNGILLIESANKEWQDFNSSLYSTKYYSARELHKLLSEEGFYVNMYYSFPTWQEFSMNAKLISIIKRIAVLLNIIPKSMKYKNLLKRIFMRNFVILPSIIHNSTIEYIVPKPLNHLDYNPEFKVLFALGEKK